jgi:polyphosphate kinase
MLDARCSMLDARCSMLDARCSMLDARCSMLDARCSMLDARNRELSWLDFNSRVLALAEQTSVPLLERVRFLAIWANNLDEFYMVRVAGLMEQVAHGVRGSSADGMSPSEQLAAIRTMAVAQYERAATLFTNELAPGMAKSGIVFSDYDTLDDEDRAYLDDQFRDRVYPVVTPLAVDPAHPFPYISNQSLNLAIFVRNPETGRHPLRPDQGAADPAPLRGAARRRALRAARAGHRRPPR